MESGKYLWVNKYLVLNLVFFTFFFSCQHSNIKFEKESVIPKFENGDLIYRHGNGFFSNYFKDRSNIEQIYSHGGIVYIKDDSTYVIHSEASEFTGIGGVKMEPIYVFLDNIQTWGVYRLDTIQTVRDSMVLNTMKYIEKNTPFDFDFDNDTDEKLYCTELIAIAINKSFDRKIINTHSTFAGKPYYAIDDTYLIPQVKLIYKHSKE